MTTPVSLAWPLVGRDVELEAIDAARAGAACRGVILVGPAGVGKSRVLREAIAGARSGGAFTRWIQATSSAASIPLGAVIDLAPADVRLEDQRDVMRSVPEALLASAHGKRIVVGVDDAHLLDPSSAALLLHLVQSADAFVIATVRSGEAHPDAFESLWKDLGARRLEVEPLDDGTVAAAVEGAVGGPLDQAAREWIVGASRGNILFARELITGALETETLVERSGLWRLTRTPTVGPSLTELVGRRLLGAGPLVRQAVELLAVGEPLRVGELIEMTSEAAVVEGEAMGLLEATDGIEIRLGHPLYGEVLRAEIPPLRARRVRTRLADTLRARGKLTDNESLRVSRWLLDADADIPAPLLLSASRGAVVASDGELGAALASRAVDAGAGLPGNLLLARAHAISHEYGEAARVLAAAEPLAAAALDESAIQYLEQCVLVLYWRLVRLDDVTALLVRARGWSTDATWQRRLDPLLTQWSTVRDGFGQSAAEVEAILADPSLPSDTRHRLEPAHAMSLALGGRVKQAWSVAWRSRPPVPLRDPADLLLLGCCSVIGVDSGEDWESLEEYMAQTLRDGIRLSDRGAAGISAMTLGHVAFLGARYRDAARWLTEAEAHFELYGPFRGELYVGALRVGIAQALGEIEDPAALRASYRELREGARLTPMQVPYVLRAEAWATAEQDGKLAGRLLLDEARRLHDQPLFAAQLTYEGLRVGAPPEVAARELAQLSSVCDARMVSAFAAHAAAAAAGQGEQLLSAAERFAAIGARAYALEATVAGARAYLGQGRLDSARRAASRAWDLHAGAQELAPPVIDGLERPAVQLTDREEQVVALVSRGFTNAEIAERLILSKRTIETYVYRAMHKRGVVSRFDL